MEIALDLIQPSPHPIRSSWDEDKMQELTDSIKEQGLIVPIKVRPAKDMPGPCCFHEYRIITNEDPPITESRDEDRLIGECSDCKAIGEWVWPPYVDEDGYDIDWWDQMDTKPKHPPFEIVYGHRRAEACQRAGLDAIEAIVEGVEDTDALIQAWIENAQREDMSVLDRARALRSIQEMTGWPFTEMARRGIIKQTTASHLLLYLQEYEAGAIPKTGLSTTRQDDQGVGKAREIRRAFDKEGIDDPTLKRRVHEHTADLPREKVREVAEAVAQAEDEAEREAILSTSPTDPMFDRLVQSKARIYRKVEREQRRKREDDPREVRAFLDAVRSFRAVCQEAVAVVEFGKFSPEAKRFAVRQLDQLIADIEALKEELEV